jgi:hypothetical protein
MVTNPLTHTHTHTHTRTPGKSEEPLLQARLCPWAAVTGHGQGLPGMPRETHAAQMPSTPPLPWVPPQSWSCFPPYSSSLHVCEFAGKIQLCHVCGRHALGGCPFSQSQSSESSKDPALAQGRAQAWGSDQSRLTPLPQPNPMILVLGPSELQPPLCQKGRMLPSEPGEERTQRRGSA